MKKDQILLRQLSMIKKQEQNFLNQKENAFIKSNFSPVITTIQTKIPVKLQAALDTAFYMGFQFVFEKGHGLVEKTYNKDKINADYDLHNYAIDKYMSRKHIKNLDKQSRQSKMMNESIAAIEGGILGLLGIGIPDIPLFLGLIVRTINEIALSYGYHYATDAEKAYILYLICGAMTKEETRTEYNRMVDHLGKDIDTNADTGIYLDAIMKETSDLLSNTLLTAKFIQGLPIVGVIGGVINPFIINKIGKYARIKYKKRYLLHKINQSEIDSPLL